MEYAFIDHYDSFSYNLLDWLADSPGPFKMRHVHFDDASAVRKVAGQSLPIVLGPGPNQPSDVLASLNLCKSQLGQVPILGICLGHQILGTALGGRVKRAQHPFHGSVRSLVAREKGMVFAQGVKLSVASYNSLVIEMPQDTLIRRPILNEWHEIEMLEWGAPGSWPAVGVQFHPESFMSQGVEPLRRWFLEQVELYYSSKVTRPQRWHPCQSLHNQGLLRSP